MARASVFAQRGGQNASYDSKVTSPAVRSRFPMRWRVVFVVAVVLAVLAVVIVANWDDSFADCPHPKGKTASACPAK